MKRIVLTVFTAAVCLLLCGFGTSGMVTPAASADPDTTTGASTTATPPQASAGGAIVVTDNPSIVNSHAVPFDSWSPVDSGNGLALHFTISSPDCNGAHATVEETTQTVVVKLLIGTLPGAVGRVCTMIAESATLDVPLPQPLGNRTVLSVY